MLSNTGINKAILLGQITTDIETQTDANNQQCTCFTMVTVESVKKGQTTVEHKEYHAIKVPEKLMFSENLQLEVGMTVYVEGKIQTNSFIDQSRVKRYVLEIVANKLEILNLIPVTV